MSVELTITDEEARALREKERCEEHHDVFFNVCPCCAGATWKQSLLDGTGRTVCIVTEDSFCEGCEQFSLLHPEVFRWVRRFIHGQQLIARRTKA